MQDTLQWEATGSKLAPSTLIKVDQDRALIELTWVGYAPSKEYRARLEQAHEIVRTGNIKLWLADLREMGAILRPDEQWTVNEWFPQLADTQLRRMAIVVSSDYFNRMSVERIMTASMPVLPFKVTYFEKKEEALAWLLSEEASTRA